MGYKLLKNFVKLVIENVFLFCDGYFCCLFYSDNILIVDVNVFNDFKNYDNKKVNVIYIFKYFIIVLFY